MGRHAFISYVREDAAAVDRIHARLESAGISVWRDTRDLWPGEDWRLRIRRAIEDDALVFIACFSHNSERRERSYQREELLLAVEQMRLRSPEVAWLIPVRLDETPLPFYDLGGGRRLDSLQWVDLADDGWDAGVARLIAGVARIGAAVNGATGVNGVTTPSDALLDLPPHAIVRGTVRQRSWPAQLPRQELHVLDPASRFVNDVCAVPVGDRMLLAVASFGRISLWDMATGQLHGDPIDFDYRGMRAVCPVIVDGRVLVAAAGADRVVSLWDPSTGDAVGKPMAGHQSEILTLCAVPVGGNMWLASGGSEVDPTVRVWDPATGEPVGEPLVGHDDMVVTATAVPVGERMLLATGGYGGRLRLWDPVTGRFLGQALAEPDNAVHCVCALPVGDRTMLAMGWSDGTLRFWDPGTREFHGQPIRAHPGVILAVCALPVADRVLLASAGHDESVRLWDPETGEAVGVPLRGHNGWITSLCAAAVDGRMVLASGSNDGIVRLWGGSPGRPAVRQERWAEELPTKEIMTLRGHVQTVTDICAVAPRGRTILAVGTMDRTLRFWDPIEGRLRSEPLTGGHRIDTLCAVEVDGAKLLASGGDRSVQLWDPDTSAAAGPVLAVDEPVSAMCTVQLGRRQVVAVGGLYGSLRLWDLAARVPAGPPMTWHRTNIPDVCAVRAEGVSLVASCGFDGAVCIWDATTGERLHRPLRKGLLRPGHTGSIFTMCAVPRDGRTLVASGGEDGEVRLWDPLGGLPVGEPYRGHDGSVLALCTLQVGDRTLVVSAGSDRSIHLWDPTSHERAGRLSGHSGGVRGLALVALEQGLVLASASHDGTVALWGPSDAPDNPRPRAFYGDPAVPCEPGMEMEAEMAYEEGRGHLRGDIAAWLEKYGRHMADPMHSDTYSELGPTIAALYFEAEKDPSDFVARLRAVAGPVGGWTAYGAHKLVLDIIGDHARDGHDDNYGQIVAAALDHARSHLIELTPADHEQMRKYGLLG